MEERLKSLGFEITWEPFNAIAPELSEQWESLFYKSRLGGKKIVEKLQGFIERYPEVPQLKNFLATAYMHSGNLIKAQEINHIITKEHPDYWFGKFNLACEYYLKKEYDKIPEIIGDKMEIQELYPERKCFHVSEVTSFNRLAIMYFCAVGKLEEAESRYEMLVDLASGHPDTIESLPYLKKARLETALARLEEIELTSIKVISPEAVSLVQLTSKPTFINQEIDWLYEYGLRIEKEKLKSILALPYESLVSDLKLVLKDSLHRFEFFKDYEKKNGYQEEKLTFPTHAVFLLGELRAEESLENILGTFLQGEELVDFWYGDFMTESFWEPIYLVGEKRLDLLKEFVLTPDVYTYARSQISSSVTQIGLHQPERKAEVVDWYRDVFINLAAASLDDRIIDSNFIGLAICHALDLKAPELLPHIKRLFDLGYVGKHICGEFDNIEEDILEPEQDYVKKKFLNVFDRYEEITSTWYAYKEEEPWEDSKNEPVRHEHEPGRNDPCPCGSGKKYKKCCLNKQD